MIGKVLSLIDYALSLWKGVEGSLDMPMIASDATGDNGIQKFLSSAFSFMIWACDFAAFERIIPVTGKQSLLAKCNKREHGIPRCTKAL